MSSMLSPSPVIETPINSHYHSSSFKIDGDTSLGRKLFPNSPPKYKTSVSRGGTKIHQKLDEIIEEDQHMTYSENYANMNSGYSKSKNMAVDDEEM